MYTLCLNVAYKLYIPNETHVHSIVRHIYCPPLRCRSTNERVINSVFLCYRDNHWSTCGRWETILLVICDICEEFGNCCVAEDDHNAFPTGHTNAYFIGHYTVFLNWFLGSSSKQEVVVIISVYWYDLAPYRFTFVICIYPHLGLL